MIWVNLPPAVERTFLQQLGRHWRSENSESKKSVKLSFLPLPQILAENPRWKKKWMKAAKRTLGVIAAIFACRKLVAVEGKPSPAREMAFRDSIDLAAEMMRRIDSRWPSSKR